MTHSKTHVRHSRTMRASVPACHTVAAHARCAEARLLNDALWANPRMNRYFAEECDSLAAMQVLADDLSGALSGSPLISATKKKCNDPNTLATATNTNNNHR